MKRRYQVLLVKRVLFSMDGYNVWSSPVVAKEDVCQMVTNCLNRSDWDGFREIQIYEVQDEQGQALQGGASKIDTP